MDAFKKCQFSYTGLMIASGLYLCNEALKLCCSALPQNKIMLYSALTVCGGIFLDWKFKENEYEKLFRMCGIENKENQVPLVLKKIKKNNEITLVLKLPAGISQLHFEKKKQELEQYLNSKIEFGFNKNLILKLVSMSLSTNYNYIFEECEKPLEVYCGNTHDGKFILDIEKCPHIICAGETMSGKTSLLDNILLSLILNKHNVDIHLIDFQAVGLGIFEDCKKVKSYGETPTDFEKLLDLMEKESEKRLKLFRSVKNKVYIEKLSTWNEKFPERALPYIVVAIDEFSRLAEKDFEVALEKFRQRVSMDRKVGIHYLISMQRPDVKCISGSTKANMPTRIAFKVVSQIDSEVILDQKGAEDIKHAGRFLIKYCGELTEVQALYIEPNKIRKYLTDYNAYKSKTDFKKEKQQKIQEFHNANINPYAKTPKKDVSV